MAVRFRYNTAEATTATEADVRYGLTKHKQPLTFVIAASDAHPITAEDRDFTGPIGPRLPQVARAQLHKRCKDRPWLWMAKEIGDKVRIETITTVCPFSYRLIFQETRSAFLRLWIASIS
ncbi:hypothetical protein X743_11420 [Mesorhizobium sp. LNHC252B00]|uniref:hypothetical protein n=1 Tax=Mesorhizobium sp. LNHC252B00 TaxID=1287252 RepID=UPI0003CEB2FC|nr:hypothetical protein [Mesorhizobium sp. LNHC252B00]ESY73510.1 hypothetical protein X743_11420 [Mesorhizobium sp. LNHC252B00]